MALHIRSVERTAPRSAVAEQAMQADHGSLLRVGALSKPSPRQLPIARNTRGSDHGITTSHRNGALLCLADYRSRRDKDVLFASGRCGHAPCQAFWSPCQQG